ncbi:hypothetical protein D3C73_1234110 [compost metagenome]
MDQQRLAPHDFLNAAGKIPGRHWFIERADQPHHFQVVRIERAFDGDVQLTRQLHVIAHLWMQIQWQVIGQQADVVLEQGFQPTLLHAGDAGVLTLPEIAVVHQHQVSLCFDGGVQQRLAGSDATDDAHDLRATFDLQAVGAIIGDPGAAQVTVGFFDEGAQGDGHKRLLNIPFRGACGLV